MLNIKELEVGDVIQFLKSDDTVTRYWYQLGVVTYIDRVYLDMFINIYMWWDSKHEVVRVTNTEYNRRRFQKIKV